MEKTDTDVVLVDGGRIPFQKSGTHYNTLSAFDMGRMALEGLLGKTGFDPNHVDMVIMGTVIQDVNTSNIARECALASGLPENVPAFTTTLACISSNVAITSAIEKIKTGQAEAIIAGGVETMSDVPIRFKKKFRQKLIETQKYKSPVDFLKFFKGLRPSDLLPDVPSISEFSTGETMGKSCDKMCAKYEISREAQDEYAIRSHTMAAKAHEKGWYDDEIFPASYPKNFDVIREENGIRADSTPDKLAKLKPAFIKPHGTVTAANASFLTDGASACLIMSRKKAVALGLKAKAILRSYTYTALKPGDELLIGPAFAVPQVLDAMKLKMNDIDVFEFHEAFAGQILTVKKALESDEFGRTRLNRKGKVGLINMDKFNLWGGSLSLGHPFGATGTRLLTTAANRLAKENGKYALIAACAAGGQGHAMIIERAD